MRCLCMLGILLLAGCGLFQRQPLRVDDPSVTTKEQERRARARLPLPDESNVSGPRSAAARPGTPATR